MEWLLAPWLDPLARARLGTLLFPAGSLLLLLNDPAAAAAFALLYGAEQRGIAANAAYQHGQGAPVHGENPVAHPWCRRADQPPRPKVFGNPPRMFPNQSDADQDADAKVPQLASRSVTSTILAPRARALSSAIRRTTRSVPMLHPRVINDLCRYPQWLIAELALILDGSLVVDGWALGDHGDMMIGEIAFNGRKPDLFNRVPSPAFVNLFRWHDNTEIARFRAVFRNVELSKNEVLRLSYRGRWSLDPFNRWQDIYFPLQAWQNKEFVEPDGPRMVRTQGSARFIACVMYGTTVACMLNAVTQTYFGKSLSDFRNICDWGSGCGRVIQAIHHISPNANLTGIDVDRDNVEWCRGNLPYAKFADVPLFPPTDIADGQFDLLYGISVFTHLARDAFEAWRDELHRIVRPGGVVLVTVNRGAALVRLGNEALILRTMEAGFDDASPDHALDKNIDDTAYYRGTYLMTSEVKRIFGERFRIRDILPQASGSSQDLVVCERI